MKPFFSLLLVCSLQWVSAQSVTLNLSNASIESAFREIEKQTDFRFIYTRDQVAKTKPVTVSVVKQSLATVLDLCFKDQPIRYHLEEKYIIVQEKRSVTISPAETFSVSGIVTGENGQPLPATLTITSPRKVIACSDDGSFSATGIEKDALITVSNVGYQPRTFTVTKDLALNVELTPVVKNLDETLIIAYGTTTKRLNTGSVEKVGKEEIEKQPVSNVLAALHGRVPGLTVQQQNGIPGSAVKIQVRGRTSINSSINNDPLIIIDGVPFAPNNASISQVSSALGSGGLSPFAAINPADIESIEVLKDADATAIYGSRGASGVILITTKKGKAGKTRIDLSLRTGVSTPTRTVRFMNTPEYVAMRKEAFANDGITPSAVAGNPGYAPDLMIWDTTAYTDLRRLLIDGTAISTDAQLRLSGGSVSTQFSFGTGYSRQTTVFPGDMFNDQISFHAGLNHRSEDKKLTLDLKTSYVYDNNNISASDLTGNLRLPPDIPSLYDTEGRLNWQQGGVSFENPMAYLLREYQSKTHNLIASLNAGYRLTTNLHFRTNLGYNAVSLKDRSTTPISSQNPATAPLGSVSFGKNDFSSFIIEPQLNYKKKLGDFRIDILAGGTFQRSAKAEEQLNGTGYTTDALINSLRGAAAVTVVRSDEIVYKYAALFGRVNVNLRDRYLLNLTARRDGSSRFGPGNKFANFGAAGMAWIFSKEKFTARALPFLSFGKLRASYGTTGNDKIGDYAYLNTYSSSGVSYQGIPGITPTTLFNPDYAWELNKKLEAALELGFFKDRLQFTTAYYRNTSSNQLINYALPSQTGGQSIIRNFPATVLNAGWEIELNATMISSKKLEWSASFNITLPQNRLTAFPNFESSSYFSTLMIGEPLNIAGGYKFAGVNTQTGVYEFFDVDGKRTSAPKAADRIKNLVKLDPAFYGGLSSILKYGSWSLDIFLEYRKQKGQTAFGNVYSNISYPGMMFNMPAFFLDRWGKPGDETSIGRFTRGSGSAAYSASTAMTLNGSDGLYGDASYIRLKNVSVSYALPAKLVSRLKLEVLQVYLQGQNLLTITGYDGGDPESQNIFTLPPLKTISGGIRLNF